MDRIDFINKEYPSEWLKKTNLTIGQQYPFDNFKDCHNSYSKYDAKKARGRVSCFLKHEYAQNENEAQRESNDFVWKGDSKIFGYYIPPDNSFFKNFGESLHHGSSQSRIFEILKQNNNEDYIQHYVTISKSYTLNDRIYVEYATDIKH